MGLLIAFAVGTEVLGQDKTAFFFASYVWHQLRQTSLGLRISSSILALDAWRSESDDALAI